MGNRWLVVTEENPADFSTHTAYSAPQLALDYFDFEAHLEQNNQIQHTSAYDTKRLHWLEGINGTARISNYMAHDNIGEFLKAIFGTYTAVGDDTTRYQHRFAPKQAHTHWSIDEKDTDLTDYRTLEGCACNRLTLNAPARGAASYVAEFVYADEKLTATPGAMPAIPSARPYVFADGEVNYEASALAEAESWRAIISRDIPTDTQVLGARDRQDLIVAGFTITAEFDIQQSDWAYLEDYYGVGDPAAPADEDETLALILSLSGPAAGGTDPYDFYTLEVNLPEVIVTDHRASQSRRDRRMETVTVEAIYNAGNNIELVNLKDDYTGSA